MKIYFVVLFLLSMTTSHLSTTRIGFEELVNDGLRKHGVYSGCRNPRHVSLTFDDGIHPTNTPKLLKILKKYDIHATFFILGQTINKYLSIDYSQKNEDYKENRKIFKKMVKDGHEIGNHSFNHPVLTDLSKKDLKFQMDRTNQLFYDLTGKRTRFMRAPEGYFCNICKNNYY